MPPINVSQAMPKGPVEIQSVSKTGLSTVKIAAPLLLQATTIPPTLGPLK